MRTAHVVALLLVEAAIACDRSPTPPIPVAASPSVAPSAAGNVTASAIPSSSAPEPNSVTVGASAAQPVTLPPPHVKVENIGMHIGGGPNDALNKAPIGDSVAPHFDEIRACWSKVDDANRGGDFGVDLLIPARGGPAKVTNPRTGLHSDAFRDCVVAVFESVDFKKPVKGLTMVSYSLRFTP